MIRFPPFGWRQQASSSAVEFGIVDPIFPVTTWQGGSTNRKQVDGRLSLDGQPVADAQLTANEYVLPSLTGADGAYSVRRDQTIIDRTILRVTDASRATVGGMPITSAQAAQLTAASFAIESAFTVKLDEAPTLRRGATNVTIAGTASFADGTPIPPVARWGYTLSGTVRDASGDPLSHVFVSVSDDEGETWALSNQTGADGRYQLRFYPVTGGADFTIRIAYGDDVATSDDQVTFQPETSSQVDLVLQKDHGMVMGTGDGGKFMVKAVPGAEYVGYLVGIAVDAKPLPATLTWPDAQGHFTAEIASLDTAGSAGFFQIRARFVSTQKNTPGGEIPTELIPASLGARTPRNIAPLLPIA